MNLIKQISRLITGLLFIFSGTVKAIDPLGSAYKFQDYFQAFHLELLKPLALTFAIILITAEFISGFAILTGLKFKSGAWGALILMSIFTPLTLILALTNPVSDCGCFGDAIHLTNWQTFGKNIVLLVFVLIVFKNRNNITLSLNSGKEWILILFSTLIFILFSLYNLRYLPVIDFLPYKKGVNIAESMIIPEGKPSDSYRTTFIYRKNGIEKEFSLEDYPADDSTWIFVDQKSKLISKGYQPPVHDFVITTINGNDITTQILTDPGYSFLMITKKINEADPSQLNKGFRLGHALEQEDISFYVLTSSGTDEVKSYKEVNFGLMDETTLKTMMRSNPGYMLLKNGVIQDKWSWANLPDEETLKRLAN